MATTFNTSKQPSEKLSYGISFEDALDSTSTIIATSLISAIDEDGTDVASYCTGPIIAENNQQILFSFSNGIAGIQYHLSFDATTSTLLPASATEHIVYETDVYISTTER